MTKPGTVVKKGAPCGALVHKVEENKPPSKPQTATCARVHSNDLAVVTSKLAVNFTSDMPIGSLARALFGLIQFALFGLLTAILALKRPYFTLDVWVRRSPHDRGLSAAMWARDWFNVVLLMSGGFFPRFNQFCHRGYTTLRRT